MEKRNTELAIIKIETLTKDPNHPRQESGDIESLKTSLKHNGILTPLTVVKVAEDKYHVVDGWRRVEALKEMGMTAVSCIVHENVSETRRASMAYVLNTNRKKLNKIERALHIKAMMEKYGLSYAELEALGYGSKSQISILLGHLRHSAKIQKNIAEGIISAALATVLLKAENPEEVAKIAVKNNWSAPKTEKFIEDLKKKQKGERTLSPANSGLKGFDTRGLEDGSIHCSFSMLPPSACSSQNKDYLESQFSEANRLLTEGGILAVFLHDINSRAMVCQCLNKKTLFFSPVTEFAIQAISIDFEDRVQEFIDSGDHAEYRALNANGSILIFKKCGSRSVPSEVAEDSKLSLAEAVECLRFGWTLKMKDSTAELISRVVKMYSFKGDAVVDLLYGNDEVSKVAKKMGREGFEKGVGPASKFLKEQREELEANQPAGKKMEVAMSEDMEDDVAGITENNEEELAYA